MNQPPENDPNRRLLALLVFAVVAFLILVARFWYVQVVHGQQYYDAATNNIVREVELLPPRGRIFDRNGLLLAENRPSFDVYLRPKIVAKHQKTVIDLLIKYIELTPSEEKRIQTAIRLGQQRIRIRSDISRSEVARLESDYLRLKGVEVEVVSHRHYPKHETAAHVLGFMGEITQDELKNLEAYGYKRGDYIGRMGVERAFEAILRGSPGVEFRVVDVHGQPINQQEASLLVGSFDKVKPIAGRDIHLTIDAEYTELVAKAFRNQPSGAAVVLDVNDGTVIAAFSKPGFNPNSWTGRLSSQEKLQADNDLFRPMIDKCVSSYFPASTFKIVGAYAALDTGLMKPLDTVDCKGYYRFGGRRFRCWKYAGHGDVNVSESLGQSCDVYYYKVADELGIDVIAETAHKFGFGERTGYPLNNESAGRVPNKQWHRKYSPDGYQRGFDLNTILGQGDTLSTPLQVVIAFAAVANAGKVFYPRVVDHISTQNGISLFQYHPKVRKRIEFQPEHLRAIQHGLWLSVHDKNGTAYIDDKASVEIAAKTGTAQLHTIGKRRIANRDKVIQLRDHAWYAAYAPYQNPEIAVVVFLEHGGHGGGDAGPVAVEIISSYFDLKQRRQEAEKTSLTQVDSVEEPQTDASSRDQQHG